MTRNMRMQSDKVPAVCAMACWLPAASDARCL